MKNSTLAVFAIAAAAFSIPAGAVDGTTLINQASVMAAGGFPYQINTPGSYRLSSNLVVQNSLAIAVNAAYVTLDLNGFSISCTSCTGLHEGVYSGGLNTTIMNGTISGFQGASSAGLYFALPGARVDHVTATSNFVGISSNSFLQYAGDLTVLYSNVSKNLGDGIDAVSLSILGSTVGGNGNFGITAIGGFVNITSSTFIGNGGGGIYLGGGGGVITGNTISGAGSSGSIGIDIPGAPALAANATITNNVITNNQLGVGSYGLSLFGSNTLTGNTHDLNGTGIVSQNNNVCSTGGIC
jgi:hypothetical protein